MIARRDLLFGAACLGAGGVAYALKPRRSLNLLGARKMRSIIPMTVGAWTSADDSTLVRPETEGTLAARLYSELVARQYLNGETGQQVMMLVAYGDTQSDLLQLHRPEACYPAVGFQLASSVRADIALSPKVAIPGRQVVATMSERQENIVYWTRLGDYLPTDPGAQRKARLLTAMQGYVPDGGLFRFSALGADPTAVFATINSFIADMVLAVTPQDRVGLLGNSLTSALP